MAIEKRCYGLSIDIYSDENCKVVGMFLDKGAISSEHFHNELINYFFVFTGKLQVDTYKNDKEEELDYSLILEPMQMCKVSQGRYHNFLALEDTIIVEIYCKKDNVDITRRNTGGLKKLAGD